MMNLFNIKGKTALVIWFKRGISFAMAEALADAGGDILGVSTSLEIEGSEIEKASKAKEKKSKAINMSFQIESLCTLFFKKTEVGESEN